MSDDNRPSTHEEEEEDVHKEPESEVPDVITNSELHKTLEEDETVLWEQRAKLYRFDSANKEWKERGVGQIKFLKHKTTNKIRLLMRREKLFKICCNHFVHPQLRLQENKSNDKSWIWNCPADYSDEAPTSEIFAIRFATLEAAKEFKKQFEDAQKEMQELLSKTSEKKEDAEAATTKEEGSAATAEASTSQ